MASTEGQVVVLGSGIPKLAKALARLANASNLQDFGSIPNVSSWPAGAVQTFSFFVESHEHRYFERYLPW